LEVSPHRVRQIGALILDISMSLDGFVAGPDPTLEDPLGRGGEQLHEWVMKLKEWREPHGLEGGETGPESERVRERIASTGATIMGRRMFSGGQGPWEDDPNADGWWGDEPPFHHAVFVLTHHGREPLELKGTTFTFVTDGIESALDGARDAAGEKNVALGGGADVAQQFLNAGLLDEISLHVAPVLLGEGTRLFEGLDPARVSLERAAATGSPAVAHLTYRLPGF
jgi:dihydrofolate reductase